MVAFTILDVTKDQSATSLKKMVTNASNLVKTIQLEIATFLPGLKVDSMETSVFTSPCAIVTIQIVSIATPAQNLEILAHPLNGVTDTLPMEEGDEDEDKPTTSSK